MNALADDLQARGVSVTRRQFAGVDHGFTHANPVEVARAAIDMIGDLLRKAYSDATATNQPQQEPPGEGAPARG